MSENEEPLSPLDVSAISLHEWYVSMTRAGFTKEEAMTIIAKVLSNSGNE